LRQVFVNNRHALILVLLLICQVFLSKYQVMGMWLILQIPLLLQLHINLLSGDVLWPLTTVVRLMGKYPA